MFGVCNLSLVPCRKEPSDRSEMVNQLLFGDPIEIIEELEKWVKIRSAYDGYESYIDKKQYMKVDEAFYTSLQNDQQIALDPIGLLSRSNNQIMTIVCGSTLPGLTNGAFTIGTESFFFDGNSRTFDKAERGLITENALLFLNAPYLWGGRSAFGIDCSGFTQVAYKLSGLKIKRDASEQATQGKVLSFIEEAQPGDLAFFDNEEGRIIHVGIVLQNNKIIHASGKVRIDLLDHHGIYNEEIKKYTHRLRVLKSYC